jgi:DMSO reductase family type II enzyme iron-sulfur subunit
MAREKYATSVKRQVAMVLDLNKCLGCQTCTVSCKKMWNTDTGTSYAYWNSVETAPGKGYPANWATTGGRDPQGNVKRGEIPTLDTGYGRAWTFDHQEVFASSGNKPSQKIWIQPKEKNVKHGANWDEDKGTGTYPEDNHYFYLPRICNHCAEPACLHACPRGSITKNEENGIVTVNQDRCHGYRFCVEACPYKKVYFDPKRQVANKCIFCAPRVEEGVAPACARQCPGRLRFVGFMDDQEGPIWKLVEKWKVAVPLHPEYGIGANVFYVPPMSPPRLDMNGVPMDEPRIPMSFLEQLFGPAVKDAMNILLEEREKKKRGESSELMDLLIAYDWNQNFKLDDGTREVFS